MSIGNWQEMYTLICTSDCCTLYNVYRLELLHIYSSFLTFYYYCKLFFRVEGNTQCVMESQKQLTDICREKSTGFIQRRVSLKLQIFEAFLWQENKKNPSNPESRNKASRNYIVIFEFSVRVFCSVNYFYNTWWDGTMAGVLRILQLK